MLRPYMAIHDEDNAVNMIGHQRKRIQFNVGEMCGQCVPTFLDNPPRIIQVHFSICHIAEQAFAAVRNDGDEIRPGLRLIISAQTDGPAVMFG
jgi:hypothetical protein